MIPVYALKPLKSVILKIVQGVTVHLYKVGPKAIVTVGKLGARFGSFLFKKVIGL